jgi:hypothetical protein
MFGSTVVVGIIVVILTGLVLIQYETAGWDGVAWGSGRQTVKA